jgi:ATP-binding cassette subfamily F protein 3
LKNYDGSIILISHDTQFLDTVCKKTVEIDNGKFYEYKASYYKYISLRKERIELQTSAFKNQQKVIEQKEKTIKRFMAQANKTKMAQSMQKQLNKIDRISIDSFNMKEMNLRFPEPLRSGRMVVKAECSKSYGDLEVLNNISLEVERGEKIAFVGQNGQGKSTLAKIIVDEIKATEGDVTLGHNVSIGYYAQNQSDALDPKLNLLETMENQATNEQRPKIRSILGSFLFSGEDVEKKVSVLSGGERARLAMALMVLKDFNLLILDEPTNHLDIQAKAVLKNTIENYSGTCIIVSHDRDFLSKLTGRTIEFRDKKLKNYLGDVNYFLEKRELDNMRQVELREKNNKQNSTEVKEENQIQFSREELKKMRRKVQYIEREIEKIEEEIEKLHDLMIEPDFYKDPSSPEIIKKHADCKKNLSLKMEQWEMQMEVLEDFAE